MASGLQKMQELTALFEHGYQLASRKTELQSQLARQQATVADTQRELDKVVLETESVEGRKMMVMGILHAGDGAGPTTASLTTPARVVPPSGFAPSRPPTVSDLLQASTGRRDPSSGRLPTITASNKGDCVKSKGGVPDMLTSVPIIVRLDGFWTEISCTFCKANASVHKGTWFAGIAGLQRHITKSHNPEKRKIKVADAISLCDRRVLTTEEMSLIRKGKQPVVPIERRFEDTACNEASFEEEDEGTLAGNECDEDGLEGDDVSADRKEAKVQNDRSPDAFLGLGNGTVSTAHPARASLPGASVADGDATISIKKRPASLMNAEDETRSSFTTDRPERACKKRGFLAERLDGATYGGDDCDDDDDDDDFDPRG